MKQVPLPPNSFWSHLTLPASTWHLQNTEFSFSQTLILRVNGFPGIFGLRDLLYVPQGQTAEHLTYFEISSTGSMLHEWDTKYQKTLSALSSVAFPPRYKALCEAYAAISYHLSLCFCISSLSFPLVLLTPPGTPSPQSIACQSAAAFSRVPAPLTSL